MLGDLGWKTAPATPEAVEASEVDLLIFFLGLGWILAGPFVPWAEFLKVGSGLVASELEVDEVELPVELGCLPLLRLMKAAGGIAKRNKRE